MADGIKEFISQYLLLDERNRALRAAAVHEVTQRAQQTAAAVQIGQSTSDPRLQTQLIEFFGPQLGTGGKDMLTQLLTTSTPSVEQQRATAVERGLAAAGASTNLDIGVEAASTLLTGQNRGQLAQSGLTADVFNQHLPDNWRDAFALRMLSGQTPGQFSMDQATAGLGEDQLTTAAQYALNLQLSPIEQQNVAQGWTGLNLQQRGQDINAQLGWAGNRLGWAQLTQQGALAEAGMHVDLQRATLEAQGRGDTAAMNLMEESRIILDSVQKGNVNAAQRQQYYNLLKQNYAMLRARGYNFPDFDPKAAAENSYVPNTPNRILGGGRGGSPDAWRIGSP